MEDHKIYKYKLAEYLAAKGHVPQKNGRYHCISPDHNDQDPSMSFYEESVQGNGNYVNCNSCDFAGDIFTAAGVLISKPGTDKEAFKSQLADIKQTLGDLTGLPQADKQAKKAAKAQGDSNFISLHPEKARTVYNVDRISEIANFVLNSKNKKSVDPADDAYKEFKVADEFWPYYNEAGQVDIVTVRFDYFDRIKKREAKDILSFWHTGKTVKTAGYPILVYNRHELAADPDKNVLWHEGEKCAGLANVLTDFIHVTWNGGSKKVKNIQGLDADCLKNREHFILPDDDDPGRKAASVLRERLINETGVLAYIVPRFDRARDIKKKGADIEEILQSYSLEEINEQILGAREDGTVYTEKENEIVFENEQLPRNFCDNSNIDRGSPPLDNWDNRDNDAYPFQILGIGDDNRAYFIDYENRLISFPTTSISENVLSDLGGYEFFKSKYRKHPTKDEWKEEVDDVRRLSKQRDFDVDSLRGRGAWRTKTGKICYYDGRSITGEPDPDWTFVRRPRRFIGLSKKPVNSEIRTEIFNLCKMFSFETRIDCMRLLSWSALAPFGGALKWRPAILVTGPSGSGKSTVLEEVVQPISDCVAASGVGSTEPGIRQHFGIDSNSVYIDEAEQESVDDKKRIEALFSLMRVSTSDKSPKTFKGSTSSHAVNFQMRSMFCFSAINPTVDKNANDNRIIRVNFKRTNNYDVFTKSLTRIRELLTHENCQGIRSHIWRNLELIIETGSRLDIIIQKETGNDARFAAGESILLAANLIIWDDFQAPFTDDFLRDYVIKFYHEQRLEIRRDETDELIIRLLDETVFTGEPRQAFSLREILQELKKVLDHEYAREKYEVPPKGAEEDKILKLTEFRAFKRVAEQYGVTVHQATRELFIAHNHHKIMNILELGKGYHRQLERHERLIKYNDSPSAHTRIDGTPRRGTIIAGFLEY